MKKITALITVLALLLSLCACGIDPSINDDPENSTKPSAVSDGKLRLAYSKAERLDPFTASSAINLQILGLLYDGLYKLDKSYQPVPVAAKNAIVRQHGQCYPRRDLFQRRHRRDGERRGLFI